MDFGGAEVDFREDFGGILATSEVFPPYFPAYFPAYFGGSPPSGEDPRPKFSTVL